MVNLKHCGFPLRRISNVLVSARQGATSIYSGRTECQESGDIIEFTEYRPGRMVTGRCDSLPKVKKLDSEPNDRKIAAFKAGTL
jgi:hypothetical protein